MLGLLWFLAGAVSVCIVVFGRFALLKRRARRQHRSPPQLQPRRIVLGETRSLIELADALGSELASLTTGVEGQSQLLCEALGKPVKVAEHAEQLWETVRRLRFLSEKLQSFSTVPALDLEPTDIGQLLAALVLEIQNYSTGAIQVGLSTAPSLPSAMANPAALRTAILFLAETVCDVEPNSSTLLLQARAQERDGGTLQVRIEIEAVSEDGGEIRAKPAPDTLFSCLSARNLLQAQGAELTIDHSPGLSALASIALEATHNAQDFDAGYGAGQGAGEATPAPHRFGGVLITEGNPTIRHMLARELDKTRRNIIVCADGIAATSLFDATPERFELLILEQESRRLRGEEIALRVLRDKPNLKVVLLTPGPGVQVAPELAANERLKILPKPFGLMELRDCVLGLLGPETVRITERDPVPLEAT